MTDENGYTNGSRVTTRDLLYAMQGMEGRIGERIERLEAHVDRQHSANAARIEANASRIVALEQDDRDEEIRAAAYGRVIGLGRILLMTAIAVGSFALGVLGAISTESS